MDFNLTLNSSSKDFPQNIWENENQRQRRRAELVRSLIKKQGGGTTLDIGCAEGYVTKYISEEAVMTIGIDLDLQNLRLAKQRVKNADFINASIEYTPFRNNSFNSIAVLEILEHLPTHLQELGLKELFRLLKKKGALFISIPYKENIIKTKCVHCGRITPLYGHLHSMDDRYIGTILGSDSKMVLRMIYRLPNIQVISCNRFLQSYPFRLWLLLNNALGLIRKGYWAVFYFIKE